ncbi:replication-associated protein [Crucivirus-241]|nr:replication-associated protein [Crucivirus-241]
MPRSAKKGKEGGTGQNACCVYDFTYFGVDVMSVDNMRDTLSKISKKYCFQLEKGNNTDKLHYQGRFSLKEKLRQSQLIAKLTTYDWEKFHVSVTSTENRDNNFYVCKLDTRVAGPFTEENHRPIPEQVEYMEKMGLYPWQSSIIETLQVYDRRCIDIIYDKLGNKGKSYLSFYMMSKYDCEMLPPLNDVKDLMRMAYDVGPKKVYIFDMPRAMNKEKLFQLYSTIETLKSGFCYDDRYTYKRRLMPHPNLCIFTNVLPNRELLSEDRWRIWNIDKEMKLVKYKEEISEEDLDILCDQFTEEMWD